MHALTRRLSATAQRWRSPPFHLHWHPGSALACSGLRRLPSLSEARQSCPCDRAACLNRHLTAVAEAGCAGTWKHPSAELRLGTARRAKSGPSGTAVWMTSSARWRHQDRHDPGQVKDSKSVTDQVKQWKLMGMGALAVVRIGGTALGVRIANSFEWFAKLFHR